MAETNGDSPSAQRVVQARIAVSIGFFMFGIGFAVWAVHIPVVTQRLGLDPAILGLALLNIGLGGVVSQPLTGWFVASTGSRPAARVLMLVFLVAFLAPIIAWNTPVFFVATLTLGVSGGAYNVAINTQASEIERARGQPTMSSFHGFFSLGALAGATLGGGIIAIGWQDGRGAAAVAAAMLVIAVFAARYFLPTTPAPKPEATAVSKRFALPSTAVLGLAVLTFLSDTVEGAVNDWSGLYLSTVRGMNPAAAASGFAAFSLAMAICRLAGGPVVAKLGEKNIVLFGGALMAIGMAIVVLSPWAIISPFGFAFVAVGAANTIPVMIGAASRSPGTAPSTGVAATSTGGLLGFLIGPPIIGFIAHGAGLSVALGLLSLVGIVLVIGAALYRWPERVTQPSL
jgi:MFS family permease